MESENLPPEQFVLDFPELQGRDRPTFANFIEGKNREALATIERMALGMGPKFLYLYGPPGAGLTHLLESYCPNFAASGLPVPFYIPGVKHYAVDDIELLDKGYARQLLQLQNAIYAAPEARLVCAGRLPPRELPLPDGVKNRLLGGMCYLIQPLDEEERFQVLKRQAALRGIVLTRDMGNWMSWHLPRDMRSLTAVMDTANQIALRAKRRVTLVVIREAAIQTGFLSPVENTNAS